MNLYKVTPTNTVTGAKSPYFIIEATENKIASAEAKQQSRLASFPNWSFEAEIIAHL